MIKIIDVEIVPQITTTGSKILISVQAEESNWRDIKSKLTDWNKVTAMKHWQELKDY